MALKVAPIKLGTPVTGYSGLKIQRVESSGILGSKTCCNPLTRIQLLYGISGIKMFRWLMTMLFDHIICLILYLVSNVILI